MDYRAFPDLARTSCPREVALMLARPSIDPDPQSFLRELVVDLAPRPTRLDRRLHAHRGGARDARPVLLRRLAAVRLGEVAALEVAEEGRAGRGPGTRRLAHNSMRPPLAPLELLDYRSRRDTDIIQEYFVPVEAFVPFMDRFREILIADRANVLSSTVRYVTANATPALAYAPQRNALAVIQMSNVGLSPEEQGRAEATTRRLVDPAQEHGGTDNLTNQLYPTAEQLPRAYPGAQRRSGKRFYDPAETFSQPVLRALSALAPAPTPHVRAAAAPASSGRPRPAGASGRQLPLPLSHGTPAPWWSGPRVRWSSPTAASARWGRPTASMRPNAPCRQA
jgi:hypothetical protein